MAFRWEDVQRLKFETGYNVANVGAEIYVLNGYAAVFDAAIAPYLQDQGSTSTTVVAAAPAPTPPAFGSPTPVNVALTLAANPLITGTIIGSTYGNVFQQGSRVIVDVGPAQETDVIVQSISGLVITVALVNAHGPAAYPVILQGGESIIRDVLQRLSNINAQLRDLAPVTAGAKKADDVELYGSEKGRRSSRNKFDDLNQQRDLARKDLAAALGIPNLWEMRGKYGGGAGSSQEYAPY